MRRSHFALWFYFLLAICMPLTAQTVDTMILGTVTDSTGAVIPGATVTVVIPSTGIEKRAVTDSSGEYSVNYLTPGNYDVTVSANGFASACRRALCCRSTSRRRSTSP